MLVIVKKIFAFISSLWALADMVLDTVTVVRYRAMCQVSVIVSTSSFNYFLDG